MECLALLGLIVGVDHVFWDQLMVAMCELTFHSVGAGRSVDPLTAELGFVLLTVRFMKMFDDFIFFALLVILLDGL